MDRDQSVYEMVEEVLRRQAKSLAVRTGQPFERALRIVADTEAGRQLRELADGEHRHKKAREWQANVFWERSEQRLMHLYCSEALSRFAAERHYSWVVGYGVARRQARTHALPHTF